MYLLPPVGPLGTVTGVIGVFFCIEKALNLFLAFSTPFDDGVSLKRVDVEGLCGILMLVWK